MQTHLPELLYNIKLTTKYHLLNIKVPIPGGELQQHGRSTLSATFGGAKCQYRTCISIAT